MVQSRLENGAIYCRVERDSLTEVDGMTFDLIKNSYYLLMSSGSTSSELSIGFHGINQGASRNPINFSEISEISLGDQKVSRTLILLHGCFMIVAWIGSTSIGIFSARYFKKIWGGKQLFGKDIWFVVHHAAMSLTWLLTISAVTIIWIELGEWRTSPHSVLGIIATVLCFIQPFTAFVRPGPNDPARPIFNFMHGSVGKLAHFLAGNIMAHSFVLKSYISSINSHNNFLRDFVGSSRFAKLDNLCANFLCRRLFSFLRIFHCK